MRCIFTLDQNTTGMAGLIGSANFGGPGRAFAGGALGVGSYFLAALALATRVRGRWAARVVNPAVFQERALKFIPGVG